MLAFAIFTTALICADTSVMDCVLFASHAQSCTVVDGLAVVSIENSDCAEAIVVPPPRLVISLKVSCCPPFEMFKKNLTSLLLVLKLNKSNVAAQLNVAVAFGGNLSVISW